MGSFLRFYPKHRFSKARSMGRFGQELYIGLIGNTAYTKVICSLDSELLKLTFWEKGHGIGHVT